MKYRVLKSGGVYYPQYKSWWTFGWKYFKEYWFDSNKKARKFVTEEYAIDYCNQLIGLKSPKPEQVVWESNPEYSMTTGPE